ncbi:hypothetical protein LX36DRAFT_664040 [Colletotrichum falcatum]|nr:hypothetical protein LX36DRAFT_664040 [Colletotrichum falcatum]
MKPAAFATLFIGLLGGAKACADYFSCHCYQANGTPNINATEAACEGLESTPNKDDFYTYNDTTDGIRKCYGGVVRDCGGKECNGIDNCRFRELCAANGATGSDSYCDGKVE